MFSNHPHGVRDWTQVRPLDTLLNSAGSAVRDSSYSRPADLVCKFPCLLPFRSGLLPSVVSPCPPCPGAAREPTPGKPARRRGPRVSEAGRRGGDPGPASDRCVEESPVRRRPCAARVLRPPGKRRRSSRTVRGAVQGPGQPKGEMRGCRRGLAPISGSSLAPEAQLEAEAWVRKLEELRL